MHNNLRITRILKSLGELGFEHYQAPLVRFFLEETLVKKTLSSVKRSVLDYFLFAVLDKRKRQELVRFAYLHFEPKDKFVWCPRKIQKQFRKAEKKSDAVGNGDLKEERIKSKDVETVLQQKENGLDTETKTQKGTDKTVCEDRNKEQEVSLESKPDNDSFGNGTAGGESNDENSGNGNGTSDDAVEMELSTSPNSVTSKPEPSVDSRQKSTNNSKDSVQEPDNIMQTDGDVDTEKPPKKKREDNKVLPSNGSAGDMAGGQMEEKAGANKATGQTSPSSQTPLKTSKHSPSLSSGREEKIPRTDFNHVSEKKEEVETLQENVPATNGSETNTKKSADEQMNGNESEDAEMESNTLSLDQNMGNS